jgi:hypothetical protein
MSDVKGREEQESLPVFRRVLLSRGGKLALAVSAVGVLLLSSAEHNYAAACRGAGVTTSTGNGTSLTKWSDGAYVKTEKDGSFEWAYPSGSDPVPGSSTGHKPR